MSDEPQAEIGLTRQEISYALAAIHKQIVYEDAPFDELPYELVNKLIRGNECIQFCRPCMTWYNKPIWRDGHECPVKEEEE